jgi:hypothetical protein
MIEIFDFYLQIFNQKLINLKNKNELNYYFNDKKYFDKLFILNNENIQIIEEEVEEDDNENKNIEIIEEIENEKNKNIEIIEEEKNKNIEIIEEEKNKNIEIKVKEKNEKKNKEIEENKNQKEKENLENKKIEINEKIKKILIFLKKLFKKIINIELFGSLKISILSLFLNFKKNFYNFKKFNIFNFDEFITDYFMDFFLLEIKEFGISRLLFKSYFDLFNSLGIYLLNIKF